MKFKAAILAALLFPALLAPSAARAAGGPNQALFFSANQDYKNGDFPAAAKKYEELIRSGTAGGDVHYNLGNTYFRMNRLGDAILQYERARLSMPRDRDLAFNLAFALDKRADSTDAEDAGGVSLGGFLDNFTDREIFWFFAAVNALFFPALALRLKVRGEWTYYLAAALGIAWISAGFFACVKEWNVRTDRTCVVTAQKTAVRSGPSPQETVLFELHAGTLVESERTESGFRLVHLSADKRGWVPVSTVEPIRQT